MQGLLAPLFAAPLFLPALPAATSQDGTAAGAPTAQTPPTPAGTQLAWVLARLRGGAATRPWGSKGASPPPGRRCGRP